MQQIITAKLKLRATSEQAEALRQTQLAYRDALNAVSCYAFAQGKTSNVTRLHKGIYAELRARYGLPSQLACSVERQVAATYKGLWTKLKKNAGHRRAKITKKRFKGLDQSPHYNSPTVQYTYQRDYTFQCDSQVSIGTLGGRISVSYQGYEKHIALIRQGGNIGDAKLWYDKARKTFYLFVSLSINVPDPTPAQLQEVVGVDVGMRYLAVSSTQAGKAGFHPGKRVRHRANHFARLRKRLQKKGTRGAKRRLRRIERRERRLKAQCAASAAESEYNERCWNYWDVLCIPRLPYPSKEEGDQSMRGRLRRGKSSIPWVVNARCVWRMLHCVNPSPAGFLNNSNERWLETLELAPRVVSCTCGSTH